MADQITPLFFSGDDAGGSDILMGAIMTSWNGTTYENIVSQGGSVTWTNLPVMFPSLMSTGHVMLIKNPGSGTPIVLGRIYIPEV